MRFTVIASLLMVAVTIGVTPGLRMDLVQLLRGFVPGAEEAGSEPAGDRLARIPHRVLESLPDAAAGSTEAQSAPRRLAVGLNDLAPAAGPQSGSMAADDPGALQLAALPPSADPLHDTEILRLSELAPAARPDQPPLDEQLPAIDPQTVALFVAIGSYDSLREAAAVVRRHAEWDPMVHKAVMNERLRHVVVLGPFESHDVGPVLSRLREAGIAEPWPLAVQLRPGLRVKGLDLFG